MFISPVLIFAVMAMLTLCVGTGLVLAVRLRRMARRRAAAERLQHGAQEKASALTRRLRLASHDVRSVGMTLHGHADHFAAEGHDDAAGIAAAAADLLDLADDLHDLTMEAAAPRVLRVESVPLGEVVDEAVAAVAATILPGQRNWRILPDLRPVLLAADPRALRHALTRVLSDAVRNTRHDDWIDIGGQVVDGGFALTVADEGRGGLMPEANPARRDSRGIGLRLTLARALVEAHGGRMAVESFAGVGSRVSLVFPMASPVPAPTRPSRSYAAPAPAGGFDGR
jgi:signal transduction histidine kinase